MTFPCPEGVCSASITLRPSDLDLHGVTEIVGERYAAEVLAERTLVDGHDVKEQYEYQEDGDAAEEADENGHHLLPSLGNVERDVRHDGKRQQESVDETEEMGVVVDYRQQADRKEGEQYQEEYNEGRVGLAQVVPVVDQLDEDARQDAKLRSRRSCLKLW